MNEPKELNLRKILTIVAVVWAALCLAGWLILPHVKIVEGLSTEQDVEK